MLIIPEPITDIRNDYCSWYFVLTIVLGIGAILLIIPEPITDILGTIIVLGIFVVNYWQAKQKSIAIA